MFEFSMEADLNLSNCRREVTRQIAMLILRSLSLCSGRDGIEGLSLHLARWQ